MNIKPVPASFIGRYLSSLAPIFLLIAYKLIEGYSASFSLLVLLSVFPILAIAWTLRNNEATCSLGLFILLSMLIMFSRMGIPDISIASFPVYVKAFIEELPKVMTTTAVLSSIAVLIGTEAYRRAISYEITEEAIVFRGGLFRRQEHILPYDKIGRVILEQGVLARLLDYGTIIPVGIASWGEEYYTRAIGGGVAGHGAGAGVGYARTLQEISRDPLKALYGVPNPKKIYSIIQERIVFTYKAEKRKVELLEDINRKLGGFTQSSQ